jgi:hypothetical protein
VLHCQRCADRFFILHEVGASEDVRCGCRSYFCFNLAGLPESRMRSEHDRHVVGSARFGSPDYAQPIEVLCICPDPFYTVARFTIAVPRICSK